MNERAGKFMPIFNGQSLPPFNRDADKLAEEGLKRFGLQDEDLKILRKGDPRKKMIAWLVRRNTSVKNEWISSRLYMGNASNLSRYIAEVESSLEGELLELKTTK